MRVIGNILWLILAGLWLALGYVIAGLLAFVLIVTIPFGIASFRLASFVIWPFGRTTTWRRNAGIWSVIGNVVWIIFFGWELALMHLIAGPAADDHHHRDPVRRRLLEDDPLVAGAPRTRDRADLQRGQ